jgi:hypothetical protein
MSIEGMSPSFSVRSARGMPWTISSLTDAQIECLNAYLPAWGG